MFTRISRPVVVAALSLVALVCFAASRADAAGVAYGTVTTGVVTNYYSPYYYGPAVAVPAAPTVVYRYGAVPVYQRPGVVVGPRPVYAAEPRKYVRDVKYVFRDRKRDLWGKIVD